MDAENERRLARRAEQQLGLITRSQLSRAGLSRGQIDRYRQNNRLVGELRGVMRAAGAPRSAHTDLLAAQLATGAVVSHRSAAWHLKCLPEPPSRPELTGAPTASVRGRAIIHRSTDLAPRDHRMVEGIRTTTAVRTLIDLGAVVPRHVLHNAVEAAFRERLNTHDRLVRRFFELARKGRRGIGPLRELLVERDPRLRPAGSSLETLLMQILAREGLPPPVRQYEVVLEGCRFFVDVCYPEIKLAIEADGFGIHTMHDVFVRDRVRQNLLQSHGWMVLRYTWQTLCTRPEQACRDVANAFAHRSLRAAAR